MTTKQRHYMAVGVLLALIAYTLFIVLPDRYGDDADMTENGDDTATTTEKGEIVINEDGSITAPEGVTIQPIPEENSISAPDLERPYTIPQYFGDAAPAMRQNMEKAIAALKDDPESLENWLQYGIAREQVEDYEGAKEVYVYLTITAPDSFIPYINLANVLHLHLKDYPEAEKYYRFAIDKNATYEQSYISFFEFYRDSYEQDSGKAEKILLEGLSVMPKSILLLNALGMYYLAEGDTEDATIYLTRTKEELIAKGADPAAIALIQALLDELK